MRAAYRATALALCAFAWFLRWHALGAQSLWYDEALSVTQASESLRDLVVDLATTDVHPPLYFTLLHFWLGGSGQSEAAVRSLSALASTLAVAALIALGARLTSVRTGLVAGALACFSPLLVYYGQETRMYALLALLSTLAGYAFVRAAEGERRWWLAYSALMAAALWMQLYATLLLLALNVWYGLRVGWGLRRAVGASAASAEGNAPGLPGVPTTRRALAGWLAAQLAAALLFLPWLPIAWGNLRGYTSPGHGSTLGWVLSQTAIVFNLGFPADGPVRLPWLSLPLPATALAAYLVAPGLAALLVGLLACRRQRLLCCWLGIPLVALFLLSVGKRDFNARYLMEAFPAYLVLAAAGLTTLWRRRLWSLGAALGLALAAASLATLLRLYADPAYARDDNRGAVAFFAAQARPGAAVVLDAPYMQPAFAYYARDRWPVVSLPSRMPLAADATVQDLARSTAGRPQVWLILWQDYYSDPREIVWTWLLQHFYVADWVEFHGGLKVLRFDMLPAAGLQPSGATLGGQVQLVGYAAATEAAPGGARLRLDLYWRTLARPTADMAIAAHLLDAAGDDYGDADAAPADGRLPTTSWQPGDQVHTVADVPLLPWTAPGAYRVQLLMYDHRTRAALPAAGPGAAGASLMLPVALTGGATADTVGLPPGARPAAARFASVGALAGYQLSASGSQPVLTLFWRAAGRGARPLKVFVHALDAQGRMIGGGDSEPGVGAAPTTAWQRGELIRDPHQITLAGAGATAAYEVGFYDPQTGRRVGAYLADGQEAPADAVRLGVER